MVSPGTRGTFVKSECVCSPGEIDQDLIVGALGGVILCQLPAKTTCLYANCGIQMRVKVAGAAKNFRRNLIFLGRGPGMVQRMIGQVAQQLAQGFRTVQGMTAKELFDLSPVMSLVCHSFTFGTSL